MTSIAHPAAGAASVNTALPGLRDFCGLNGDYYSFRFQRLANTGIRSLNLNWAALLWGPYWAVARGMWLLFWMSYTVDVIALGWLLAEARVSGMAVAAGLLLIINHIGMGLIGNYHYWNAFCGWVEGSSAHRFNPWRLLGVSAITIPAAALAVVGVGQVDLPGWLKEFPASQALSTSSQTVINYAVEYASAQWGPFFDGITGAIRSMLNQIENVLLNMPWPALVALVSLLCWRVGRTKLLLTALVIMAYLGFFGYWQKSISTMSLVVASVLICVLFGVPLGILCAKYQRLSRIANPVMDMMQTMPSFVYLLPAIAFFSIGKPPAILATVVFGMPPVIKLTALGISQIPLSVKEAMLAFGASPLQLLIKAELPMAAPSIMAGINQSIMMSLSMVVVGALIGAGGLGYDVLSALQEMNNGAGILAGVAIVMCAMLLDRTVQGARKRH